MLKPVDDLLLYSGNFEFGTDKPNYIEVEASCFAATHIKLLTFKT